MGEFGPLLALIIWAVENEYLTRCASMVSDIYVEGSHTDTHTRELHDEHCCKYEWSYTKSNNNNKVFIRPSIHPSTDHPPDRPSDPQHAKFTEFKTANVFCVKTEIVPQQNAFENTKSTKQIDSNKNWHLNLALQSRCALKSQPRP